MKTLTSSFKSWFIIILSGMLVLMFIFACSSPPQQGTSSGGSSSGDGGGDEDDDDKDLACSLPKCSGSGCCNKGSDKHKGECEDKCDDLNLDSDGDEVCLTLDKEFIEDTLLYLFDNKNVLAEPSDQKLVKNIKDEDIGYICGAVKELGHRVWSRRISGNTYGRSEAKAVLGWVAKEKKAVEIFKNAEEEEGIKMFQTLLAKVVGGSGDQKVVDGLDEEFEFNDDDNNDYNMLNRAVRNEVLLKYIHEEVLENKEEGICGEDSTNNLPEPVCGTGADKYPQASCDEARRQNQRACLLGVYCLIAKENNENDNDLREDLAQKLEDGSIESFIKRLRSDGGLNLTEKDSEDWPHEVCLELRKFWNNGSGLNLGLTESSN